MNQIEPKPEDVLHSLDWQTLTCQAQTKPCNRLAVIISEIRAIDLCTDSATNIAGNIVAITCKDCFEQMLRAANSYLQALNKRGRVHCLTCNAPLKTTLDIIRAVKPA